MPPMRLVQLRSAMQRYALEFDAARLSSRDATAALEHATAIKNMAAGVEAMAAARVAKTKAWRASGDRSPGHHLARTTGVSVSQANETLRTAQRLAAAPATAAALQTGEVSLQQAAVIADAVAVRPEAEGALLDQASRASFSELRDSAAREKAKAIDLEARHRHNHERRALRTYTDTDGLSHLHWSDNPERIAGFMGELESRIDRVFQAARKEGLRESREAYAADAMMLLARDSCVGTGKQSRSVKILARVNLPRLLGEYANDDDDEDDVCEIVGYGPVPASAIRAMMDSGDPFLAAVVTNGKQVLGVAHLGRKFTAHQQTALEWLHPTCAVEGCNSLARLEYDHRDDWAKTRFSLVDLADRMCRFHHHQKTCDGWALVAGTGKRAFVAPSDTRHPDNAGDAEPNAPPDAA